LIALFEKLMLFKKVLHGRNEETLEADRDFNIVLTEIARYLTVGEERIILAMKYLCASRSQYQAISKDRLYRANQ